MWRSHRDLDVDPEVESAYRKLMNSVDDLRTARIRMENFDIQAYLDAPTEVTEEFMQMLAEAPGVSAELTGYSQRVQSGECRWSEIEHYLRPLPPEVTEIKASDRFIWKWSAAPPPPPPPPPQQPLPQPPNPERTRRRALPEVVGPSDWPDDFDEHPGSQRGWLV